MLRDLGQPIMQHYFTVVENPEDILDPKDKPKKPGEIEIDLTSMVEALTRVVSSVNRNGLGAVDKVKQSLQIRARRLRHT